MSGEDVVSLTSLEAGARAVVTHVEDEPPVVFSQLVAFGIYLGMEVRIESRSEQRIAVEGDGRRFLLAPLVAQNVSIRRLEDVAPETAAVTMDTLASLAPARGPT